MQKTFEELGSSQANLVKKKQEDYGDSFGKSAAILEQLYPKGIRIEQYRDLLAIIRILDKIFRIATLSEKNFESKINSWGDINGYSLLQLKKEYDLQEK